MAIRDAAGVSTGALNHQFPTKASLMAAVVDRFCDQRLDMYKLALRSATTPEAALSAILDTSEALIRSPEMTADLEIYLARRNDPELDRLTKPICDRFDRRFRRWIYKVRRAAGVESLAGFDRFQLLNHAVFCGLAMALIGKANDQEVNEALKLWRGAALALAFGNGAGGISMASGYPATSLG